MKKKDRSKSGAQAANIGIANEHIALGILMHRYNASKVDLPLSKYDIVISRDDKNFIRIQSKTANKAIGFIGNMRAGKSVRGGSDPKQAFRYSTKHCDILMGVKTKIDNEGLKKVDLYFLPTILVEKIENKSGISIGCLEGFKNNWKILENYSNNNYLIKEVKRMTDKKIIKLNLKS